MKIQIHTAWKMNFTAALLGIFSALVLSAHAADPQLSSWFTANTGKYARYYTSVANRTAGLSATTWSGGQTSPTYAGVHEIDSSSNWVYLRNSGLASYVMGPSSNPNVPKNQGTATGAYRFPRGNVGVTNTAASKTLTSMGAIGKLVDGVSFYNTSDGYSYGTAHGADYAPPSMTLGDGIWNRDALPNESVSFDYALNHAQPSGDYHSHANPIAVRYQVGDNVNYDSPSKNYFENTNTLVFKHSPIIGWANDGLPLYGPYGYSNPTNRASVVRRMISGYVLRDGLHGTTNLGATGRTTLPAWAALAQNRSAILSASQYGPNTNATYPPGHYSEDYDYLGDHSYTQGVTNADGTFYDLNQYNARWCVTPEYPNGTWAYFESVTSNGISWYPYHLGRWFLDSPTGGTTTLATMNADTPLTLYFKGATNLQEVLNSPAVNSANGNVTLAWSALEGGTYQVLVSSNLSTWTTNLALNLTATNNIAVTNETGVAAVNASRFYRIKRIAVAAFDSTGY